MGWVVIVKPRPRFTPGKRTPGTHLAWACVGPRAGLDTEAREKILYLCRGLNPFHPFRSQTLYTDWAIPDSVLICKMGYFLWWQNLSPQNITGRCSFTVLPRKSLFVCLVISVFLIQKNSSVLAVFLTFVNYLIASPFIMCSPCSVSTEFLVSLFFFAFVIRKGTYPIAKRLLTCKARICFMDNLTR
jgi:hypothetical protein